MTENIIGFDKKEREQNSMLNDKNIFDIILTTYTNKVVPAKLNLIPSQFTLEASILNETFNFKDIEAIYHCTFKSQIGLKFVKKRSLVLYSKKITKIMEIFLENLSSQQKFPVYWIPNLSIQILEQTDLQELKDNLVLINAQEYRDKVEENSYLNFQQENLGQSSELITSFLQEKVKLEDFSLLKVLGKGAHGKVLLCSHQKFDKQYAMKILKKEHLIKKNQIDHTLAEKTILQTANHPFLIQMNYCFQTNEKLYFVMDLMKGGDLFKHLKRKKRFSEIEAKFIVACIAMALGHLHSKKFIYRDLKPENVLFAENGYIRLTDFGLSKFLKEDQKSNTFCGTPEYMAPEMILKEQSDYRFDWWSLGVLAYELIFGIPPFYSTDVQKMYQRTVVKKLRFKKWVQVTPECQDFLKQILRKDPEKRLGSKFDLTEIKNHEWFKDVNWDLMYQEKVIAPYDPMQEQDWQQNFDSQFTKLKPKDSICHIDPEIVSQHQNDFDQFDFDNLCVSEKDSVQLQLRKQATPDTTDSSNNNLEEFITPDTMLNDKKQKIFFSAQKQQVSIFSSSKKKRTAFKFQNIMMNTGNTSLAKKLF